MNVTYKSFKSIDTAKKKAFDLFRKDSHSVLITPNKVIKDELINDGLVIEEGLNSDAIKVLSTFNKGIKDGVVKTPVNIKMLYLLNPTPKDIVAIMDYCFTYKLGLVILDVNP